MSTLAPARSSVSALRSLALTTALGLAVARCGPPAPTFDDHTVTRVETEAQFESLATPEGRMPALKVVITSFDRDTPGETRFYDARFYTLHDEWYWFRLLNNQPVPGDDGVMPVPGQTLATIADVYAWARMQPTLPLDLQFADGRLYSWRFYENAFGASRKFGLATILRVPPRNASEGVRWAFELEFGDNLTHAQLSRFFERITPGMPASVAPQIKWLVRSSEQETLAERMERERLPYWDRILRYSDVVVPGAREVYSDGVTAGYLRLVRASEGMPNTNANEVLVFERVPDFLPAAAGVVTAVPQTPLAHINLLARNRGIPNAHVAGALEDPSLSQLIRGYSPVVYFAESPSTVRIEPLTGEQYTRYVSLSSRPVRTVSTPAPDSIPYLIDLSTRMPREIPSLLPTIGGKSAGYIELLSLGTLALPDRPHALTVRAYTEHLAPLRERIGAVLGSADFVRDVRVRELLLEGQAVYLQRHPTNNDRAWVAAFNVQHPAGTSFGDLSRAQGIRGLVQNTPIQSTTLARIRSELATIYADLAPTQGIRFRSSSNVEDIEGFNGAGLYESFTGFLEPQLQPRASDQSKTVERAIQQVWGSFWGFEAFEERKQENIDHLSAAMGVTIHPRFDDPLERATGVCTLTITPPNDGDGVRLEVNVQRGAESVANPNPSILPEVDRVIRRRSDGAIRVERVRRSTLSPDTLLLDDAALRRLFDDTLAVTERWLQRENAPRPASQRSRTLTIDFEFHDMLAGWPALRDGTTRPARLVLKQARTLEPGPRTTLAAAQLWPVPRDVLHRARRVFVDRCQATIDSATVILETLRVQTDRSLPPDVGFADVAFDASVLVTARGSLASLGWAADASYGVDHSEMTARRDPMGLSVEPGPMSPARTGFDRLTLSPTGELVITRGAMTARARASCASDTLFSSPRDYLLSILGRTTL